jgi:hypothetical protein
MSKLVMKERRHVEFTGPLLREAVLSFDREHNGRLWRSIDPNVTVVPGGDGRIEIATPSADGAPCERVERSAAWVAAACLHFCFAHRVPIPRQATKRIEPIEGGLQLVIELEISVVGTIGVSAERRSAATAPATPEAAATPTTAAIDGAGASPTATEPETA